MRHLGYVKIIRLLEALYKDTMSAVRVNWELNDWFKTLVGVLQGCILSPLLFNILLKDVMALATTEIEFGALISGHRISNLRFADDIDLLAESEPDLQSLLTTVDTTNTRCGLRVSSAKTEVQQVGRISQSLIGTSTLTQVSDFVYLGGTLSYDATSDKDIARRVGHGCRCSEKSW